MDAKVFVCAKVFQYLVGYAADPHLQSCAIFHERGYLQANFFYNIIRFERIVNFQQFCNMPNHCIDLADMNKALSMGSRHQWINLGYNMFSCFYSCLGNVDGDP